jgi:hypothetical protein
MPPLLKLQYRNLPVWEREEIKQKKVTTGYTIVDAAWHTQAFTIAYYNNEMVI